MCVAVKVPEDFLKKEGLLKEGENLITATIHRNGYWDVTTAVEEVETTTVTNRWVDSEDGIIKVKEALLGIFPTEEIRKSS